MSSSTSQERNTSVAARCDSSQKENALLFIKDVKSTFGDGSLVFNEFLGLLRGVKEKGGADAPTAVKRVIQLFRGHDDLILGFNQFLPEEAHVEVEFIARLRDSRFKAQVQSRRQAAGFGVLATAAEPIDLTQDDEEEEQQHGPNVGTTAHAERSISGETFVLPEGLKLRCIRNYGWTEEVACNAIEAYIQFMALKRQREDWESLLLSPPPPINFVWHLHILDVKHYAEACQSYFGQVIGRIPDAPLDACARAKNMLVTKAAAKAMFGQSLNKEAWSLGDGDEGGFVKKKRNRSSA